MQIIKQCCYVEAVTPNALHVIEAAGRTCYKSEDKLTSDSAENFVQNVIRRGHLSVIEHANATLRFITDRGVTHELIRHRLAAYSQESTRFVNYLNRDMQFILPVWFYPLADGNIFQPKSPETAIQYQLWHDACRQSEIIYAELLKAGQTPQQARTVLNNSLKTEIAMTANFREWRHVFNVRCAPDAHPQMKALMLDAFKRLYQMFPVIFADIAAGLAIKVDNTEF